MRKIFLTSMLSLACLLPAPKSDAAIALTFGVALIAVFSNTNNLTGCVLFLPLCILGEEGNGSVRINENYLLENKYPPEQVASLAKEFENANCNIDGKAEAEELERQVSSCELSVPAREILLSTLALK